MAKYDGIATASIDVMAPAGRVFQALMSPTLVREYLFGAQIRSDWQAGHPITFSGTWKGKRYEDKGVILAYEPPARLKVTHYSPLSGLPDAPENYHTVTYAVSEHDDYSRLTITQENNRDENEVTESVKTWKAILEGLKYAVERRG